jgi:hypothetical protein
LSCKTKYITFTCQESSNFLVLEIVSFIRHFGKISFLEKILRFAGFAALKYAPHFAYVYLQYASSSTWFRVISIFSKFWNFVKGGVLACLGKTGFFKNVRNTLFLNILSFLTKYITFPYQKSSNFLFLEIVSFSRNFGKMSFLEKIPRFAGFGGVKYTPHNCVRLFTICVELYMVSSNFNIFEILKFRHFEILKFRRGYWRFWDKLDFSKRSEIRFFLIYCLVKQNI